MRDLIRAILTFKQGESISTRCGVLVHRGDVKSGRVAERFRAYGQGKS